MRYLPHTVIEFVCWILAMLVLSMVVFHWGPVT